MTAAHRFSVDPGQRVGGEIEVPGDKSVSHRALMLGALAEGRTAVHGFLPSEDCIATLAALEQMQVSIRREGSTSLTVEGVGLDGFQRPATALDLGNSGTAIRLLMGLLAGQDFDAVLTGDASLRRRPMERVAAPLRRMGAKIETTSGSAPVRIHGGRLEGMTHSLPVASAQLKSALLLAGLQAQGRTTIESPGPSRDHTERMLAGMGARVERDPGGLGISIAGPCRLTGRTIEIPGDFSSAAFFIVAGLVAAGDELVITNVGINPTRTGLLTILERMGAHTELRNVRKLGAEPVADIAVARSRLHGTNVPPELTPLAIDEFPILFVAAAAAEGETRVSGAAELRHKESDRIAVMAEGLQRLGATVEEFPDGLRIVGGALRGATVDSGADHRVAMAFAVAGLACTGPIEILNTSEIDTSFPGFVDVAAKAGLQIDVRGDAEA